MYGWLQPPPPLNDIVMIKRWGPQQPQCSIQRYALVASLWLRWNIKRSYWKSSPASMSEVLGITLAINSTPSALCAVPPSKEASQMMSFRPSLLHIEKMTHNEWWIVHEMKFLWCIFMTVLFKYLDSTQWRVDFLHRSCTSTDIQKIPVRCSNIELRIYVQEASQSEVQILSLICMSCRHSDMCLKRSTQCRHNLHIGQTTHVYWGDDCFSVFKVGNVLGLFLSYF